MNSISIKAWHLFFDRAPGKWISASAGSALLFTLYLILSRSVVYNSDNASILLEAQAMRHGNVLLQGWYMPIDNFLTIEIPVYALGLLLGFSMTALMQIVPALLYTLIVLSGGYLASLLLREKPRVWSVLAFLGIVAFPALDMAQNLLLGPIHLGTILFVLIGLIAYRRFLTAGRGRKAAFASLLLMIVLIIVGDPFALVLCVLPLILTECIDMLAQRRMARQGVYLAGGVTLAVIPAFGIRRLLDYAGVHSLLTAGFLPANLPGMASNAVTAVRFLGILFHANVFTRSALALSGLPLLINAFVVLVLVYATARWSIRSFCHAATPAMKVVSLLSWSSIGTLAAFTLSTLGGASGLRYLFPILFFSGIASFALIAPLVGRQILIIATILVLVMNATLFAASFSQAPPAGVSETELIALLQEHHLVQGIGTYWASSIVTVRSEERVVVRQVVLSNHHIHPYYWLADEKWFDASNLRAANFIVYMDNESPQAYYAASVRSFGTPDHHYHTGAYTILTWQTPLLTHLQPGYAF